MLVQFAELVRDDHGRQYIARAYGAPMPNETLWEGWIEFTAVNPPNAPGVIDAERSDPVIASGRETTQPNRTDTVYWATGLTPVYLEGALQRALTSARSGRGGRRTPTVA